MGLSDWFSSRNRKANPDKSVDPALNPMDRDIPEHARYFQHSSAASPNMPRQQVRGVSALIDLRMHSPEAPVETDGLQLVFSKDDPLVLQMVFLNQRTETDPNGIVWRFGRQLLLDALDAPMREIVGEGDVRIYKVWVDSLAAGQGSRTVVELRSPAGRAEVVLDTVQVRAFAQQSLGLLPVGHEHKAIEQALDYELSVMLNS